MTDLLADLQARGLVHDSTDLGALAARLGEGPIRLYYGCDPTAPSLHVGNLIGLLVLRRFADAGHQPIALVGGATGMIGDPGGRSEERNLLDEETLARNVSGIRAQVDAVVGSVAELVDNRTWTADMTVLEFLRDVGKHVTVNQMLAKESVKARVASEHGISFTEFSYMLLQANDYWHLHSSAGVELQIGGSDQWGNIVAGVDMIRRRSAASVHAFTWPLMVRSDGAKFGKSAGGAVWLDPALTSPYQFFQYWMNADDRDLGRFLLQLTLLPVATVDEILGEHQAAPERRLGQRRLATEVTSLVHGAEAAEAAMEAATVLFGGDPTVATDRALATVAAEVPTIVCTEDITAGIDPIPLLVATGLAKSNSDARRLVQDGAIRATGRVLAPGDQLGPDDARHDRWILLARGRKAFAMVDRGKTSVSS